jgi:hypothetical protein
MAEHPREPAHVAVLGELQRLAADGVAEFPLSSVHYMELTENPRDEQRNEAAVAIATLSRFRTMVDATSAVALEADGYDTATHEVWSVVVNGDASVVRNVEDVMSTTDLPLFPWHGAAKSTFVRIVPRTFSGRRFRVADRSIWASLLLLSGARPTAPE